MKNIFVVLLCFGFTSLYAYPIFTAGVYADINAPNVLMGEEYKNEPFGSIGMNFDAVYGFDNGFTIGAFGLIGGVIGEDGFFEWGSSPIVGYTFIDNFMFQAFFNPITFVTNHFPVAQDETTLDYGTGFQLYIGILGRRSGFFATGGSFGLGLGGQLQWGKRTWSSAGSNFSGQARFRFSISLRTSWLFASLKR